MTTDKELLELAAKAAGYTLDGPASRFVTQVDAGSFLLLNKHGGHSVWNPLTDDGEALRLAVNLCMNVKHDDPNAVICGWSELQRTPVTHDQRGPWHWKEWLRDHDNDRNKATRRAITRAAAAIGKKMQ